MKAAILSALLLVTAHAHGAEGAAVRPPIVRVVRPPSPELQSVVPPAPPAIRQSLSFHEDGSDLYSCGRGSAVNYASTYRAFESRYHVVGVDENEGYSPARPLNVPDPEFPSDIARGGYVSVLVAVSKDGRVRDSMLVCSTDSVFDEHVAKAVAAATFSPAMAHGLAVESLENIEYWMPRF